MRIAIYIFGEMRKCAYNTDGSTLSMRMGLSFVPSPSMISVDIPTFDVQSLLTELGGGKLGELPA